MFVLLEIFVLILLVYVECTTDVWTSGGFICQGLAIIELSCGLRLAEIAQNRKRSYKLSPKERHAYARQLYEKQYRSYPAAANHTFFVMARMDIQMGKYERAGKELEEIRIKKCSTMQLKLYYYLKIIVSVSEEDITGVKENRMRYLAIPDAKGTYLSEDKLDMWIKQRDIEQMAEGMKKAVPDRKEHPMRTCIITMILAYSTAFYGLWYGINRDNGYEVRLHFTEISVVASTVGLVIVIVCAIISIYRRNCQELVKHPGKIKALLLLFYGVVAALLLMIIGTLGQNVIHETNWTETITEKDGKYVYIKVKNDYGRVSTYRADNPFVMQNLNRMWPFSDTMDEKDDEEKAPDTNTDNPENESDTQNEENAKDDTSEYQGDGLTIQNEMLAVYNYLQRQNTLQNMAFSYTASAKGEVYAVVSEMQEEKDGNMVTVRYCLYDNGGKKDAEGNPCEELVLEKVYPDGGYENELVNFYLVNADTMQVTDEQKDTW